MGFLAAMDLVIPKVKLPFRMGDMQTVANHLIQYHYHWNETTANQIVEAYDPSQFKTQSSLISTAGTEFCFRCGTRSAVRALSAAGIDTYLYVFDFHGPNYRDPTSEGCHLTNEVLCGAFHGSELPVVWGDLLITPAGHKMSNAIGTYWSNMAKFGTPNGPGVDVQWPQYNESTDMHLLLGGSVMGVNIKPDSNCPRSIATFGTRFLAWESIRARLTCLNYIHIHCAANRSVLFDTQFKQLR